MKDKHWGGVERLDESEIETRILDIGSLVSAVVVFVTLLYLYTLTSEFGDTPGIFPATIISVGILVSATLVVKELVTRFIYPGVFTERQDEVTKHLTGSKSQFPVRTRVTRLASIGVVVVSFFVLATVNVLLALAICYPASIYLLGMKDRKTILLSTAALLAFVYVVFVLLVQMPLDLF